MVRFKNRWLLVDVTFDPSSTSSLPSSTLTLFRTIRSSLQDNFGDVAAGALGSSISIKYYSPSTHTMILRCSRIGVKEVWGAITLCNEWEGKSIRMVTLHCGGTIRKVQEAAIRINRRRIEALYREKKQSSLTKRPILLFQNDDQTSKSSAMDGEAQAAIVQDKQVIHAIQQ